MEDAVVPDGSDAGTPPLEDVNGDDPLSPSVEEENSAPTPPVAAPHQDTEVTEDLPGDKAKDSDDESVLSEIDEAQFEDFDPTAIAIEDRNEPVPIDETNINLIGTHKRKRTEADGEKPKKKKKEGKRERPKKRKRRSDDDDLSGGEAVEGKRVRKRRYYSEKDGKPAKGASKYMDREAEPEEHLTEHQRKMKEYDLRIQEALKNPTKRKKVDAIVQENYNDNLVSDMRHRMVEAVIADQKDREAGRPAVHKLKLLPEVSALMARDILKPHLLDPDIQFMDSVRLYLEPAPDGNLPSVSVQLQIMKHLRHLHVTKEALVHSHLGTVILFYTRSKHPSRDVKFMAEKLLYEWSRPFFGKSADFRQRHVEYADYVPGQRKPKPNLTPGQLAAQAQRERALANPMYANRVEKPHYMWGDKKAPTFTVAPRLVAPVVSNYQKPLGADQEHVVRKIKQRGLQRQTGH